MSATRRERDTMGEMDVPADALWGAQTERARRNFTYGDRPLPRALIEALGLLKAAVARVHGELGILDSARAAAIAAAADAVARGEHDAQFVVGVFQTGSGTSTNMNANEVIARLAGLALGGGAKVHPNDDVNRGQSSNDVFPSALHLALVLALGRDLIPAFAAVVDRLHALADEHFDAVKIGRTHLMDAVPIRFGQEFRGHAQLVGRAAARLRSACEPLCELPLGGTAVGTGINADPRVAPAALARLSGELGLPLRPSTAPFQAQSSLDAVVAASGDLRALATALFKVVNDLRWMASGPHAGLGEIVLPAVQPGSSIMPAKVNPVILEAALMACVRVFGCDAAIAVSNTHAQFELHTMMPLVASEALEAVDLLTCAARSLCERALDGLRLAPNLDGELSRNPILATALAPRIGYDLAASIAKEAELRARSVLDVARERTSLDEATLIDLLDPRRLCGERGRTRD